MARKRLRPTIETLIEVVGRRGLSPDAVDLDRLLAHLELPEFGAAVEDERVARALREMQAARTFAEAGIPVVRKVVPALRAVVTKDHRVTWIIRTRSRSSTTAASTCGSTSRLIRRRPTSSPAWRRGTTRPTVWRACAPPWCGPRRGDPHSPQGDRPAAGADRRRPARGRGRRRRLHRPHGPLPALAGLHSYGPKLPRSLNDTLTPVRRHAKAVAREGSRLRRLRDQVEEFGAYIERFVAARRLNRRILFHMGPTNSGKTYAALQHLTAAANGAYLAPLRLLALENYEALLERGLRAGMITGEEVLGEPNPTHTARTIETADLTRPIDVAVIDEIQMLSDPDRGWAWTNAAVRRARADRDRVRLRRRPVVCPACCRGGRDSLEVIPFTRKSPLLLVDDPVPLEKVQPGDAVVAFSRRAVTRTARCWSPGGTGLRPSTGPYSPEVRRAEAARFRSGEADVLVTTDAIGMGLNLGPLKRIVFSAVRKWDGTAERALTHSEIRQIAGRAGRYGHQDVGYVAAHGPGRGRADPDRPVGRTDRPGGRHPVLRPTGSRGDPLGRRGDADPQPPRGADPFRPGHLLYGLAVSSPPPWRRSSTSPGRWTGRACRSRRNLPSRSAPSTGGTRSPWACWSAGARQGPQA